MSTAKDHLEILSALLLGTGNCHRTPLTEGPEAANHKEDTQLVSSLGQSEFANFVDLANKHHVIVRSLESLCILKTEGQDRNFAANIVQTMSAERARIAHALSILEQICNACESEGCEVVVIKSLDHWPDLGGDLDLFTPAASVDVIRVLRQHFNARIEARSWGDRLADKWNFSIPGLPELVEFHVGRLGQTGEQVGLAKRLSEHARPLQVGKHSFLVPAAEDRLIISTLQRMYRHFYFRLCDIVDTAKLIEANAVDYEQLRATATTAGVWEGTATFLAIVSDYVETYRGEGLAVPSFVRSAARFGGDQVSFKDGYLRVPILPHSVKLFASELGKLAINGDVRGTARLSLFPGLAAVAAIGFKLTGSDKGIW